MSDAGQDIPGKWADNFEDLASPVSGSEYDGAFADSIKDLFSKILQEPVSSCASITVEEGNDAIMSLKAKKVSGNDEVDAEHLIFGDFHPEEHLAHMYLSLGISPVCSNLELPFLFLTVMTTISLSQTTIVGYEFFLTSKFLTRLFS